MASNTQIRVVINGAIESVKSVIPITAGVEKPTLIKQPFTASQMGVLIELKGSIKGHIIIEGHNHVFSKIGEAMFGMSLEGEMLNSFTGELGNMIAGNLSTTISQKGMDMDITPPALLNNQPQLNSYDQALSLPIHFPSAGTFKIILLIDNYSCKQNHL
ncbi:MAG: chemotaxis protein CheX [Bacillus sp. (in: firmicutes)]